MNIATPSSQHRLPRNAHRLLLAVGCGAMLLLLASSVWQGNASFKALDDLRQQGERIEHLDSMLIQLMDAENAVRGYLLSGNRDHLLPYENARATANGTLDAIRHDLEPNADNDAALADLAGLVTIKLRSLEQAIERGMAGDDARAEGKRYTDRIRDRLLGLKAAVVAEGEASFGRSARHVERMRWVVAGLALGALLLMAVLFLVIERQGKLREQIAAMLHSENERLDSLVQERTAELSNLASYLTNAREAEKARLARELHDELGSLLTAAKIESGWVAEQLNGTVLASCSERLGKLTEFLDRGIALKRRIIDGLRPPLLEELGLVSTLRILGEEFVACGDEALDIQLPDADVELAPAPSLALYRIAQEALTNVRKHAHATRVTLALRVNGTRLELEVADDGVGLGADLERTQRHGLAGMKHRVQMCAGDFRLASQPGGGTRIVVGIPLAAPSAIVVQEGAA
jgi:protein-histidine pros-kinase